MDCVGMAGRNQRCKHRPHKHFIRKAFPGGPLRSPGQHLAMSISRTERLSWRPIAQRQSTIIYPLNHLASSFPQGPSRGAGQQLILWFHHPLRSQLCFGRQMFHSSGSRIGIFQPRSRCETMSFKEAWYGFALWNAWRTCVGSWKHRRWICWVDAFEGSRLRLLSTTVGTPSPTFSKNDHGSWKWSLIDQNMDGLWPFQSPLKWYDVLQLQWNMPHDKGKSA